jgi:YD repeat-containing protein
VTETHESYSAQGVLLSVTTHDGRVTTLTYSDANTPRDFAPAGGLLIAVTEHATYSISDFDLTLRFKYDAKSRIIQMTDPTGGVTRYGYDSHDNLASVTWPDGNMRRFVYEDAGFWNLLTGILDETGSRIATWAYDAQGRAVAVSHPDTTRNVQFVYGNSSTTVTDSQRTTTLNFASVGGVRRPIGSSSAVATTATAWDASGRLLTDTAADGSNTEYAYDTAGRTIRAVRRNTLGTTATSIRYADTASVRPSLMATPLMMRGFAYDERGNVIGMSELTTDDATGTRGFDAKATGQQRAYGWTYDNSNRLNSILVTTDGKTTAQWQQTYDGSGNKRIALDRLGNQSHGVVMRYAAHRPIVLIGSGFKASVTYDLRGRVTRFAYAEQAAQTNGNLVGRTEGWVTYTRSDGVSASWQSTGEFIGFRGSR